MELVGGEIEVSVSGQRECVGPEHARVVCGDQVYEVESMIGPEVGIEELRENLIGILWEFYENFKRNLEKTACTSDS